MIFLQILFFYWLVMSSGYLWVHWIPSKFTGIIDLIKSKTFKLNTLGVIAVWLLLLPTVVLYFIFWCFGESLGLISKYIIHPLFFKQHH